MSIVALVLLVSVLYKSKFCLTGINEAYISKEQTLPVKGFFVLLVFVRHALSYIDLGGVVLEKPIYFMNGLLAQSIVAMFFFYGGYGIFEQIKIKGESYIRKFPKKRLLKIWLMFVLAVGSFAIMDILTGRMASYDLATVLLAFTGWTTIGNSNWFMFAIFVLYIFVIIAFNLFKNKKVALAMMFALTLIYSMVMLAFKTPMWMDTVFCFPLGMVWSLYREKIENVLSDNRWFYAIFAMLAIVCGPLNYIYGRSGMPMHPVIYPMIAGCFAFLTVMLTMKVKLRSKVFSFFGKYVFWFYILQRIPMIIAQMAGVTKWPYAFLAITLVSTICLSVTYGRVFSLMSNRQNKAERLRLKK